MDRQPWERERERESERGERRHVEKVSQTIKHLEHLTTTENMTDISTPNRSDSDSDSWRDRRRNRRTASFNRPSVSSAHRHHRGGRCRGGVVEIRWAGVCECLR